MKGKLESRAMDAASAVLPHPGSPGIGRKLPSVVAELSFQTASYKDTVLLSQKLYKKYSMSLLAK